MSQTTTNVGRSQLPDPDLGFDTLDGGTALHAALRANFTALSNNDMWRYVSVTLANGATSTLTHNFGLNLTKLKYIVFEGGVQRTAAQVAADYGIAESGGSSTTAIVITNNSGGSKTLLFCLFGGKMGLEAADFDAACSIDTTGNIRAAELRTTGEDIVINHDASGAGADWKSTIRRPSTGMAAAAIITLPTATSTVATKELAEVLALKTLTGCAAITLVASAAIDWAAGNAALGASIGANTLTVAGATSTVRVPGALSSGTLLTDSDDHVLNNDAVGSGADWKATLRRPATGMTAAAVWTGPASTGTLATLARSEVFTNKDYDGGTASDTSRITLPKATKTVLDGLTRKAGTMVYATDLAQAFIDNGTALVSAGGSGGGGGGGLTWHPVEGSAPLAVEEYGENVYQFESGSANKLRVWMKVPTSYVTGNQIRMRLAYYNNDISGTNLFQTVAYLVRKSVDAVSAYSTNFRSSTNTAASTPGTANVYQEAIVDLTSATGTINSIAVTAGDLILVELQRGSDSSGGTLRFIPSSTEPSYQ